MANFDQDEHYKSELPLEVIIAEVQHGLKVLSYRARELEYEAAQATAGCTHCKEQEDNLDEVWNKAFTPQVAEQLRTIREAWHRFIEGS